MAVCNILANIASSVKTDKKVPAKRFAQVKTFLQL